MKSGPHVIARCRDRNGDASALSFTVVATVSAGLISGVERGGPAGEGRWGEYVGRWTAWNHVRTDAALAAASFAVALRRYAAASVSPL